MRNLVNFRFQLSECKKEIKYNKIKTLNFLLKMNLKSVSIKINCKLKIENTKKVQ